MQSELSKIEKWALKHKKGLLSFASVVFTLVATGTSIFAPIHELGHLLTAYAVGGHGHFVSWSHVDVTYIGLAHELVGAMGNGAYGLTILGIYFLTKKNFYVGVMLKTACFFLPFNYLTLTDFEMAPGGAVVLVLINILLWRIAFGPFKGAVKNYQKKHNTVRIFSDSLTK